MLRVLFGVMVFAIVLSLLAGLLHSPKGIFVLFVIVVAVGLLMLPGTRGRLVGLLLALWLLYGAAYSILDAASSAHATGKKGLELVWELVKQAVQLFVEKRVGEAPATVYNVFSEVKAAQEEIELAKNLCHDLPFVQRKFLGEMATGYCGHFDAGTFQDIAKIFDGLRRGVTGPLEPFIVGGFPASLNSENYIRCLASKAESGDRAVCNQSPQVRTTQAQRLCLELSLQLQTDNYGEINPLAPKIRACRAALRIWGV